MKTLFVTRHPAAVEWFAGKTTEDVKHVSHFDINMVNEYDRVIGTLPINIVADLCYMNVSYTHLSLSIPAEFRGQELTVSQMDEFNATLTEYEVKEVD